MKNNPTLFTLLKAGCKIQFPSGFCMQGDPGTKYIEVSHSFGSLGLWLLNEQGLKNALADEHEFRKELERESRPA